MKNFQKGQSLVEIIIVMGLSIIILPALLTGLISSRQGKAQQSQRTQAVYLLNETVDAVRSVRERGWAGFAVNGIFHTAIASGSWILSPGLATINGLTQSVVVEDVNRDSGGAITSSGGTLDPSSKKVDISISWEQPYLSTVSATLFLTRYLENNSFTQTTAADFDVGTKSGTIVTNTAGGEVTLGAGGYGDWCAPNLSITALDLPKSGAANALTAIEGKAFAGTGNDSSGVSFANIAITNTNPPTANITGTFDGYKTNAVFGETNYAYIATDNNSKEVEIINLTTNPYIEAGYFNAPFNADGNGVFVAGNTGFMTTDHFLYSFNLSSRSGSRPQLGSVLVTLFGNLQKVYIVGNYAYIAVDGLAAKELSIIDISNPSNMSEVGYADVNSAGGKEVYVNSSGTRAYLATSESGSQKELFIIDITNKNSPSILGSYDTNGMSPKGVTVVPGNRAIIVGTGGYEYQVVNITNDNPVVCPNSEGLLNIDSGVNGVSSVIYGEKAYSYIITGDAGSELKIIEGGPGGGSSENNGTFESQIFDVGHPVSFNRFSATTIIPSGTSITYQVAVSDPVSGLCSNAVFNFIDSTGPIYLAGQCFKYKALLLSEDSTTTPILESITINYSP